MSEAQIKVHFLWIKVAGALIGLALIIIGWFIVGIFDRYTYIQKKQQDKMLNIEDRLMMVEFGMRRCHPETKEYILDPFRSNTRGGAKKKVMAKM